MKNTKGFRKMLAVLLALMMAFTAVFALAEGEAPEGNPSEELEDTAPAEEPKEAPPADEPTAEEPAGNPSPVKGDRGTMSGTALIGRNDGALQGSGEETVSGYVDIRWVGDSYNVDCKGQIQFGQDVKVTSDDPVTVEIGKNIESNSDENNYVLNVFVSGQKEAVVQAKDLSAKQEYSGAVEIFSMDKAKITATVGNATASGGDQSDAIDLTAIDGTNNVTVNGNVNGEEGRYGLCAVAYDSGINTIQVNGSIKGNSNGVVLGATDSGTNLITVDGDVSGGWGMNLQTKDNSRNDIVITGTLSGQDDGFMLHNNGVADPKYTEVTVWKAENTNVRRNSGSNNDEYNVTEESAEKFLKECVHYIVKLSQPEAGSFSVTQADGSALAKKTYTDKDGKEQTVDTAKENEKVYLKAASGYEIESATNGEEAVALDKDEQGNFFCQVARGGGVLLSVILKAIQQPQPEPEPELDPQPEPEPEPQPEPEPEPQPEPQPEPEPEPQPEPQPEPEPAAVKGATKVILMFYADAEDAGTEMTAYVGQQITLPAAPAKDGATFLGWAESDVAPNDPAYKEPAGAPLGAGAQYKVTGPTCFVAVWQK